MLKIRTKVKLDKTIKSKQYIIIVTPEIRYVGFDQGKYPLPDLQSYYQIIPQVLQEKIKFSFLLDYTRAVKKHYTGMYYAQFDNIFDSIRKSNIAKRN